MSTRSDSWRLVASWRTVLFDRDPCDDGIQGGASNATPWECHRGVEVEVGRGCRISGGAHTAGWAEAASRVGRTRPRMQSGWRTWHPEHPDGPPGRRCPSRSRPRVGSRRRRSPRETRSTPRIDERRQTSSSPTTGGRTTSGETRSQAREPRRRSLRHRRRCARVLPCEQRSLTRVRREGVRIRGEGGEGRRAWRRGMASLDACERQRSDVPLATRQPRDRGACPVLRRLPARRGRQRRCRSSSVGRRDRRAGTLRTG